MSHDFEIDVQVLVTAATATADAVQQKRDFDVDDYVPKRADVANDIVWDALDVFQDRWERGLNDMTDDLSEVSGRLGKVAAHYVEFDAFARQTFEAVRDRAAGLSTQRVVSSY
ncbi:hypothetical protein [Schaalia suimastitidis]|uniref:hypothetical protein n=1 Tax=Schaalia suimastitidis TaxID=121163 RepID=UPI000555549F|nr:hypothetical protein [Schaalia suimastitidis]